MTTAPLPSERLSIEVGGDADAPELVLSGDLDPHTSPMLSERVGALLDGGASGVTLDVRAIAFADSAGLRVFADTQRRLSESGGTLQLRAPTPGLVRLLSITGLADHLTVLDD